MKKTLWHESTRLADPACGYKWGWSTVNLTAAQTNSCHRVDRDSFTSDTFSEFHNTPAKRQARKKMVKNQWPGNGCEYCRDIEKAGGISDRLEFNNSKRNQHYTPEELLNRSDKDPVPTSVFPTILEMYFTNLCNLGCVYCKPEYSSVLENEAKKFPEFTRDKFFKIEELNAKQSDTYEDRLKAFWDWFEDNAAKLKKYHILGGEPFFQDELIQNLEFFERKDDLSELEVTIFSNLKVPEKKFRNLLERLQNLKLNNKLKEINIVCSLDCWGPQQEYIRTGLNMSDWERNFNILLNDFKSIELEIHGTITGMSIGTMPDLVTKWIKWKETRDLLLTFNLCFDPSTMAPSIFKRGFFVEDFRKMYTQLSEDNRREHDLKGILLGLEKFIDYSKGNLKLVRNLQKELREFDKRRGTDHTVLFPWLDVYINDEWKKLQP